MNIKSTNFTKPSPVDRLLILTGATRGLGRALAEHCLTQGVALVTLSRQHVEELDQLASTHQVPLTQILVDFNDRTAVEQAAKQIHAFVSLAKRPRLIQNAGVVTPVTVADHPASFLEIEQAYLTNIVTPTFLTNHFLASTSHSTDRRIMLISSGAGRQAIQGWVVYCASKAALDRYAEVVSLEQGDRVRIASVAPGMINTPMQATIRNIDVEIFPVLEKFIQIHDQGALANPATVAQQLLTFIEHDSFGQKTIDDIRQHEF